MVRHFFVLGRIEFHGSESNAGFAVPRRIGGAVKNASNIAISGVTTIQIGVASVGTDPIKLRAWPDQFSSFRIE